MNEECVGSNFDDFLEEEGILQETEQIVMRRKMNEIRSGKSNALQSVWENKGDKKVMDTQFLVSVPEVYIYEWISGKLLLKLDKLTKCDFYPNKIFIRDASFNKEYYKLLYREEVKEDDRSPYQLMTEPKRIERLIVNNREGLPVKVVAKSELRDNTGNIVQHLLYNFPNATLLREFHQSMASNGVAETNICILVEPFNENGDIFEMIFE